MPNTSETKISDDESLATARLVARVAPVLHFLNDYSCIYVIHLG